MSFTIYMKRITEKAGAQADNVVKKVAIDVMTSVVEKSPVDTGRFKGNWQIGVGSVNSNTNDETDDTPLGTSNGKKLVEVNSTLAGFKAGRTIFISNSLPYARRLEDGYSTQSPPNAMVRLTILETRRKLRKLLK